MSLFSRRQCLALSVAAACSLVLGRAHANAQDDLPKGPITLVVPFAAGGATDNVGRLIAQHLGERIDRTIVVENAGGAGGTIGAAKVARASPDGNTLLMGTIATHVINPLSMSPAPYDAQTAFTPISLVATVPNVLLVSNNIGTKNVQELTALLKAKPGQYTYGSSGVGTPPHLSGELFKSMAGVDIDHVPYKGGGPAMADLMAGHIPILFDVLSGAAAHIRSGSVRALGVTTAQRSASFPDLPTVAESGLPGYETWTWNAIFGPAGLPDAMAQRLSTELALVVAEPEVQDKLKELSATPVGSSSAELATLVCDETKKWGGIIASIGGLNRN